MSLIWSALFKLTRTSCAKAYSYSKRILILILLVSCARTSNDSSDPLVKQAHAQGLSRVLIVDAYGGVWEGGPGVELLEQHVTVELLPDNQDQRWHLLNVSYSGGVFYVIYAGDNPGSERFRSVRVSDGAILAERHHSLARGAWAK